MKVVYKLIILSLFVYSCEKENSVEPPVCDEGLIEINGECVTEITFDTNWTYDSICESEGYYYIENVPTNIDCKDDNGSVQCGNCFYYSDLLFLNEIIVNSRSGENPPNVYPYELGYQFWIEGRLGGLISISNDVMLSILGSNPGIDQEYIMDYTLSGSIPNSINSLVPNNFRTLMLPLNSLSGSIPDLGNYPNMDTFDLSFNELTGSFPTGIDKMINSDVINLSFNQLSGDFPDGILNNFNDTHSFNVSNNKLSGILSININPEHTDLGDLRLGFDNNSFTNITGNICDYLDQIQGLYLGGNSLCLEIPTCISTSDNFNHGISLNNLFDYSTINQDCP